MIDASQVIVADGIGRRFGRIWALRDIDLIAHKGEITGLIGADGAGKTTLLQVLAAILDPTEGTCTTLGYDTRRRSSSVTGRIGYMAQGFTLYERLTVSENLTFAAKVRNVKPAELTERRERLLHMANLGGFLDRKEGALSGGMRKKLALCTNLIHEPPLLLLDEPGLGVDPISRRELWQVLESYRNNGMTIVISTSYMDEAQKCDRVVFLDGGRILATGTPAEIRNRAKGMVYRVVSENLAGVENLLIQSPETLAVERRGGDLYVVTRTSAGAVARLGQRLGDSGSLEEAEPGLQDAFFHMKPIAATGDVPAASIGMPHVPTASARSVPGIVARDLTRRFGKFTAVDDVTLEVGSGEIFGLLGANGAGKTTLIRMLCGLLNPSHGAAKVAGFDIGTSASRLREHIGYVSQRFSLYFDLTVQENLRLFASAYGLDRSRAREAAGWATRLTELTHATDVLVENLSAAMRQRVALACAILHDPAVLFLDEPTSGVDPTARTRFWHLIRLLAQRGSTVMVTTHYMDEAAYCDRLGFMDRGRMVAVGTLSSLKNNLPDEVSNNPEDIFLAYMLKERIATDDSRTWSQ